MFERYTEGARRAIFFARYQASESGSPQIEPAHLLLALFRAGAPLFAALLPDDAARQEMRRDVEAISPASVERRSTSVDLPLSRETKYVLAYAAEESERLNHLTITCAHLLAGLLRAAESPAAQALEKYGIDLEAARREASRERVEPEPSGEPFRDATDPDFRLKTATAMGMARAGSQHSTYRFENEEMVIETDRAYFGEHIIVTERIRKSVDGKTLLYRLKVSGPGGKSGEYEIEFELPG